MNQDIKYIEAVQKRKWNLNEGGNGEILPFHVIQEYENKLNKLSGYMYFLSQISCLFDKYNNKSMFLFFFSIQTVS